MNKRILLSSFLALASCAQPRIGAEQASDTAEAAATASYPIDGSNTNEAPPPSFAIDEPLPFVLPDPDVIAARNANLAMENAVAQRELNAYVGAGDTTVIIEKALVDHTGNYFARAAQYYRGVKVANGGVVISKRRGAQFTNQLRMVNGVDTRPAISEERARITAESVYPNVPHDVASELMIDLDPSGLPRLVHMVRVTPKVPDLAAIMTRETLVGEGDDEASREDHQMGADESVPKENGLWAFNPSKLFVIDAMRGDIVSSVDLTQFAGECTPFGAGQAIGTGYGHYNGQVTLRTTKDGNNYTLIDRTHALGECNLGNVVLNSMGSKELSNGLTFYDSDNVWGNGDGTGFMEVIAPWTAAAQTPAVDVLFGIEMTSDFLYNVLGRRGFDGQGSSITALTHFDKGYVDARHIGGTDTIVFGDGSNKDPLNDAGNYPLSTVAHELGHNVFEKMGHSGGHNEARAINEAFGDTQGAFVGFYTLSSNGEGGELKHVLGNWDWRVRNPELYMENNRIDPNCPYVLEDVPVDCQVFGQRYYSAQIPNLPEHVGGIPLGRAVMHLAEGTGGPSGTQYYSVNVANMAGIGVQKAAIIFYKAFAEYEQAVPTYTTLRTSFENAAKALYGNNSPEQRAVRNAFAAIGVGPRDIGSTPPTVAYAGIYDVDQAGKLATLLVQPKDDTGSAKVSVTTGGNEVASLGGNVLETLRLDNFGPGQQNIQIVVTDSDSNVLSTNRQLTVSNRKTLTANPSFEELLAPNWILSAGSASKRPTNPMLAVTGDTMLDLRGNDVVYQNHYIAPQTNDLVLTYFVKVLPGTRSTESMTIELRDGTGTLLEVVGTYKNDFAQKYKGQLTSKGWLKVQKNISSYKNKSTLRLALAAHDVSETSAHMLVDHALITSTQSVVVDPPAVQVLEPEETVVFNANVSVPSTQYAMIRYITNYGATVYGVKADHDRAFLSIEGKNQGFYSVKAQVIGHLNEVLAEAVSGFYIKSYTEHVNGGRFENGLGAFYNTSGSAYSVYTEILDGEQCWRGQRCLRLGGTGAAATTIIETEIQMPASPKSLDLSLRVKAKSNKPVGVSDYLTVRITDEWGTVLWEDQLSDASSVTDFNAYMFSGGFNRHKTGNNMPKLPLLKLAGKRVKLKIEAHETGAQGRNTRWFVDDVSVQSTSFGLQMAPANPSQPPLVFGF